MKIIVCGGRTYANKLQVFKTLYQIDKANGIDNVITGGCAGADSLAGLWAEENQKVLTVIPADWKDYGRKAGPLRNLRMLEEKPDLVVAFPGGKGTEDMVKKAIKQGISVRIVDEEMKA
jgi:ABC-type Fe3+-hydroxamate transport system substrate-binding protein